MGCVEVIGISKTVELKYLKHTVCKDSNSIDFEIKEDRIETCQGLTQSDCTVVKFSKRNDWQHLMCIKKGLKVLNQTNLRFPEGTNIYVNGSLLSIL